MKYIAVLDSENEFTEEVIETLKNTGFLGDNPRYAFEMLSIEKQERKVGKWKSDGHGHIVCTACNEVNVTTWKSKHCPCCGAEMKGENNNEKHII